MPRPTPYDDIQARLSSLGARVASLPRKWERLGDVLVVRLPDDTFTAGETEAIAAVYAEVLRARIVLRDRGGIKGDLREPDIVRLYGEGSAETLHVQDGIRYRLDPERVMWSSGNMVERIRMGQLSAHGDTVVDLFAGIGYLTLPLLVHAGAERAVCCELNPVSARFLHENARLNDVAGRIEVRQGDCRDVAPTGVADRVLLGWFPGGHRYLDVALRALKPEGGIIHYHDTTKADAPEDELLDHLAAAAAAAGRRIVSSGCRVVKSYAPGVVHAVLDAGLAPLPPRTEATYTSPAEGATA
ncbi:MAG: class I SAM-dependent methyltransferase family protein [Euryarchaeota archaeon]|nr:class I SAM-dependent methyltransferase family protein [Euryarchaeota archaeon]